ncbi:alpha/beta fold hydrolase [Amycolatopsis carbonis]|uniref:Alpha/beta fold hydrolase n=1 Tax=Amycolatopsis carbonis TaxID=715471 RepID=A0A9Y2MS79_9PSEU|nr:alpha/beta fold hydrolase [Amycolatopsis sp. 2-15]WIX75638.1 alpha/beta fold hydrolase [Amycolatopsis sp. 2-15]
MRFVLVHGAAHGAWCWELLIPELVKLGHEAVAIDLPGAGERSGEPASIAGYRDAVIDMMESGDVLVGHSMGSAVVAVAADARPDLVGHLCLVAGPLPVEGKPLSYQSTSPTVGGTAAAQDEEESAAERSMKFTEDGLAFYWDKEGARETFYGDCDDDIVDWATARLTPQPLAPVIEPIQLPNLAAADLPRSYVVCLQDRSFPPRPSRLQARRLGVQPLTINTSHSPFLSRPALFADLLVRGLDTPSLRPASVDEDPFAASATG